MNRTLVFTNGAVAPFSLGSIFCVGRNYAEHAAELGNAVPEAPLLFSKPAGAVQAVRYGQPSTIVIPTGQGACHHELEIALLIGKPVTAELLAHLPEQSDAAILATISGVGLALDLTLRDVQDQLKQAGHPWERAKAFHGSCPLTDFVPVADMGPLDAMRLRLLRNGNVQQEGDATQMIFSLAALLREIAQVFSLQPGDVVLTGTPAGVGPLQPGDELTLELVTGSKQCLQWHVRVAAANV
ncbi:fumarylacetoacetate hydrolase family protein [Aliidiomarina halalkaliphila]|uniref:fumarylacetoacetate hydrolase family protein n=1 Tax=Aliidiomarina halalkaliphila TaxID=2593535 RepID=UPI00163DE484|nr:fumarylacetoacetate hydrolase family protein [Aliidiomarina halalkaliphila]